MKNQELEARLERALRPKKGAKQMSENENPTARGTLAETADSYNVTISHRGGFKFVTLSVLTADQKTYSFEFAPAFARALSDELLRAAAKAVLRGESSPLGPTGE